ncbi:MULTISPECIES: hypothetical protein [unclassified Sphingomonas]|jgi:hypothetical protein|uniref:hypothetical protein n=1 Tax=unclassified Sphingomonas TaxID=196159 RepID=UPI001AE1BA9C|nr:MULTISPECIES: hypothetical protein [unclassified Sphingomonas]MDR6849303.1 hypothetical protein [Sphingomonas sp. BE137]
MKLIKSLIAALLAIFTLAAVPATAQVWAPPPAWGPGWRHWIGHHPAAPGWYGPVWYAVPGPHYGWYRWHGGWYRDCGWRWAGPHARVWRCY